MPHIGFDRPLDGVRVIDLSRLLPGPFCSLLLADMGADIIKIEAPPGGDYARWYPPLVADGAYGAIFASVNRSKRSVALNLKADGAVDALLKLVADADVVLESFRPGVAERLGVGFDACREVNDSIIYCAITGFGQDGPLSKRAGHDLGYLALSGALEQTGPPDAPQMPGFQLADIAGGALYATSAISTALYQVARGGGDGGVFLDISMTEGALSFHLPVQAHVAAGGTVRRGREMLTGGLPCYRIYRTADGRHLAVGALEPKFWAAFAAAIELPDLASDGHATGEDAQRVIDTVQARLEEHDLDHWREVLAGVDCCVEPILSPAEVREHPQHQARDVFFEIGDGAVAQAQTATPLTPAAVRGGDATVAPKLGEHGEEVLREAGLDDDAIARLVGSGALVVP